jgi:hypothetical protein
MARQQFLEHIAQLRTLFADHPFWTFLAIAIAWSAGARLTGGRGRRVGSQRAAAAQAAAESGASGSAISGFGLSASGSSTSASGRFGSDVSVSVTTAMGAAVAIGVYVAIAIWYAGVAASYYDFAEPSVACIAWLFARGQPIYHAFDAAERYAHMYGPLAFMIPGWFLAAVGPGLAASKAVGTLAGILGLAAVHRLLRSATTPRHAIALTGLFALLCLMFRNASFWIRPDSFSLLFATISLLAATSRRRWLAAIGLGVSTGVLVNLKLTGPLYALPAFALLASRVGIAPIVFAALTAMVTAIVPFAAFPNVSLANYLVWVKTSAGNGLLWPVLRHNIEWALFLLLPIAWTRPGRRHLLVNAALLAGVAGVAIAASKPGAGPYHLMPFIPAVLYLVARHSGTIDGEVREHEAMRAYSRWRAYAAAAFVLATLIVAGVQQLYFIGVMQSADGESADAAREVTRFADANPGRSIAMGYANTGERSTFVRPVLVFRSGRYLIDAPAVQEFEMSGLDLPAETIEALRRCDVEIWLIPKGAAPFDGPNKYPAMAYAPLFSDAFKHAFVETYEHVRDESDAGRGNADRGRANGMRDFDVWRCRATATATR